MYKRVEQPTIRRFVVFTAPHIADPAWVNPVIELDHVGRIVKRFTDGEELFRVARTLRDDLLKQQVEQERIQEILNVLGISMDEYMQRLIAFQKKKATCNPAESIYCGQCDDCKAHEAAENEGMGG